MHQGNWKCSKCGGTISELPFIPRSESGLTCRTCYAKSKNPENADSEENLPTASEALDIPDFAEIASEPMSDDGFDSIGATTSKPSERPKTIGNWKCASCHGDITSLPFTPRDTSNLKCLDCFKRSKA